MHTIDWSNLRFVFAVAQAGSAAAAARMLGVNHSTVVRRVQAFEEQHQIRIFDHLASGYRLTEKGKIFFDAAENINTTVKELELKLHSGQDHLSGTVKITTTDSLYPLLTDALESFHNFFPDVSIDLIITNHQLQLESLDADIAVRPLLEPPSNLVGRPVSPLDFNVYAHPKFRQDGQFIPYAEAPWIGLLPPLASSAPGLWMRDTVPEKKVVMRSDSFLTNKGLAEKGCGYAVLPSYLMTDSQGLSVVNETPLNLQVTLWIVSHKDLLRSNRVQACVEFLETGLRLSFKRSIQGSL